MSELLHMAIKLVILVGLVGLGTGCFFYVDGLLAERRQRRRARAMRFARQLEAMRQIDQITATAIREMGRIARDGRPDA